MDSISLKQWLVESANYIGLLAVLAVFFIALERVKPIQAGQKFTTEKWTEIWLALFNKLFVVPFAYIAAAFLLAHTLAKLVPYQLFDESIRALPFILRFLLALFILDMIVYIRHRFTHKYLWRVHVIHHCTKYVSWITSLRLHPVEVIVDLAFSLFVLHVIGFGGYGMMMAAGLIFLFNLFTHVNMNLEWPGVFHYLVGSPNYHRWHHAMRETEAFDKNFAVIFPFIDVLFGTHYHPRGKLPAEYGIYQREGELPIEPTFWGHMRYPWQKVSKAKE